MLLYWARGLRGAIWYHGGLSFRGGKRHDGWLLGEPSEALYCSFWMEGSPSLLLCWTRSLRGANCLTEASPSGAGSATLVVLAVRRVKHCAAPSGDWSGGRDGRSHSLHLLLRACRAGAPPWSARASTPPLPGQHAPNWGMLRRFRPHRRDFAPPALQLASRTPLLAAPGSGLALTLSWGGLASRRSLPRQHAPNWGMLRRFRPHRRPNAPPRPPADPRTLLLALRPSRSWRWLPWSDARPLLHC